MKFLQKLLPMNVHGEGMQLVRCLSLTVAGKAKALTFDQDLPKSFRGITQRQEERRERGAWREGERKGKKEGKEGGREKEETEEKEKSKIACI